MRNVLDCINAFIPLLSTEYELVLGRKGVSVTLRISFDKKDCFHLMGLQYLVDRPELSRDRGRVFDEIADGTITIEKIESSDFYNKIEQRVHFLPLLEQMIDSNDTVFKYNKKANMFTGNPLPIQQTYSAGGVFNGSVKWDGSSSSQTYQASGVTISVSNGTEDLFALYRVTFQDMGSSYFNTYIKSADMMYQSPNSYSYKTIANMANLNQKMIDYYPDEGSMMGTYNTKVKVNWMNGLSYVNASYSTNAMLYIDYLAPLGEVSVSF